MADIGSFMFPHKFENEEVKKQEKKLKNTYVNAVEALTVLSTGAVEETDLKAHEENLTALIHMLFEDTAEKDIGLTEEQKDHMFGTVLGYVRQALQEEEDRDKYLVETFQLLWSWYSIGMENLVREEVFSHLWTEDKDKKQVQQ